MKKHGRYSIDSKILIYSLIIILFVSIRIVIDITSFIPSINNKWHPITWTIGASLLLIFNVVSVFFSALIYRVATLKHRPLIMIMIIIQSLTLFLEIVWLTVDVVAFTSNSAWSVVSGFVEELKSLTVIAIAANLVVIPIDIISTYFVNKLIK